MSSLRLALNMWCAEFDGKGEFPGKDAGFSFYSADWSMAITDSRQYLPDALAHYDEAIRRQAICALTGATDEARAWKNIADALNQEFGLKRNTHGDSQERSPGP